jgi:hypothetical protein
MIGPLGPDRRACIYEGISTGWGGDPAPREHGKGLAFEEMKLGIQWTMDTHNMGDYERLIR